ncbi:MAG TPA: TetR/AcrR family transcriptional regulator [Bacteroidales bacterium]|nr:TetR/AcrR family transcriptional regulator [Bacteroidales bacterium]HSA44607.1 TetR/AcrR family transcriptional regulator [Bacteroidales bacterium]
MKDERYERILNESGRIFQTYGIRNVSMDDICTTLGISKKTLYQYVNNKADLIFKILEAHHEVYRQFIQDQLDQGGNAIDIMLAVDSFVCSEMKNYTPDNIFVLKKYYPEVYQAIFEMKRTSILEGITANLNAGIRDGLYRKDLDVDLVARMFVKNLEEIHQLEMSSSDNSYEKIFGTMYDHHIRAIVTPDGLEYYEKKKQRQ